MFPHTKLTENLSSAFIELQLSEEHVRHLREREAELSKSLFPPARCFFKSDSVVQINHANLDIRKLISRRVIKYLNKEMPDTFSNKDFCTSITDGVKIETSDLAIDRVLEKCHRRSGTSESRENYTQTESNGLIIPTEQIKLKPLTRGRIAPSLHFPTFCKDPSVTSTQKRTSVALVGPLSPPPPSLPNQVSTVTKLVNSPNSTAVEKLEATCSERANTTIKIQTNEVQIGNVIVRGISPISVTKEQMTGKFLYCCTALSDICKGTELQHHVWGTLLNQVARRLLVIGPPASGKRKAFMSVAAQVQRCGPVIVVTSGRKRTKDLLNTIGFLPSVKIKPHWRGTDANILIVYPGWLRPFSHKLSKVAMLVVDLFDQLIDWGLERLILEAVAKLPPESFVVATARTPSKRLFQLAARLDLSAQIEMMTVKIPEQKLPGRCYVHDIIEFSGSRRQAVQNLIDPIEHGTKLIVLFAKTAKEGNQLSEHLEDQGICDVWSFHNPLEEVRIMSKEHLASKLCALYIAINNDHECLAVAKGFVDIIINIRPAECDQVIAFRSSLLKPGGAMFTLRRVPVQDSTKDKRDSQDDRCNAVAPSEEMLLKSIVLLMEYGCRL